LEHSQTTAAGVSSGLQTFTARGWRLPVAAAGRINRGQVIEHKVQDLPWTIGAGHLGRAIEAVEPEFDASGRLGIVAPHPLHEFSIGVGPAEAVAEPGISHSLIRCRTATGHVLVYYYPTFRTPK
jgi:hypothetical protein